MAKRLDSIPDQTKPLVGLLIRETSQPDSRVSFLVAAGDGKNIMQRVRVFISRGRKRMARAGKKQRLFSLHHTIHPETHNGKRMDCVVIWQTRGLRHEMREHLEDLLAND